MNRAFLALLGGAVVSGLTPLVVRWIEIDPAAAGFWRIVLMLPMLWLWGIRDGGSRQTSVTARDRWLLVIGGAAYGADIAVWFWSIELTNLSNARRLRALNSAIGRFTPLASGGAAGILTAAHRPPIARTHRGPDGAAACPSGSPVTTCGEI
jgi:uncharacterized membrane protein